MPLDRRAQRLLDMLAATSADAGAQRCVAQRRDSLRALARMTDADPEAVTEVEERRITGPAGPIGVRLYIPANAPTGALPGLVFFHGGGWVAGDLETHDGLCRRLANRTHAKVIAVDYRLAPEHPFPASFLDCFAATRWAADNATAIGIDPNRLIVGGNSAGGGIAAAVCRLARDEAGPAVAAQLLICPILDMAEESASRREFADGYFIARAALAQDFADYRPADVAAVDARLSPLHADDLTGLPPTVLHTAEYDPFRDEGEAYARRLAEAGVPTRTARHDGMIHYFYAMPRAIPYAVTAADALGADMRALIG